MALEYKAYLNIRGREEIGFVLIDSLNQYNYYYLKNKVANIFPVLNLNDFSLYWIDDEGDKIQIKSNEDVITSINRHTFCNVRKLYVVLKGQQDNFNGRINNSSDVNYFMNTEKDSKPIHTGVYCNWCRQNPIKGFRYKCLVCPDYDLCVNCEKTGNIHSSHPMFRLPVPLNSGSSS